MSTWCPICHSYYDTMVHSCPSTSGAGGFQNEMPMIRTTKSIVAEAIAANNKWWERAIKQVWGNCELQSDDLCPKCNMRRECQFYKLEQIKKEVIE